MNERVKKIGETVLGFAVWAVIFFLIYYFTKDSKSSNPYHGDYDAYYQDEDQDCGFEDGSHDATVNYYNPDTGTTATYDLEVEVENCEVTTIYFPKGGWLDSDHIDPAALDEEGDASLEDDRGRSFEVHLDN